MTETGFQFAVLRYTHDQVTQEFVNIGVAVYAPDTRFFKAKVSGRYSRISEMFEEVDGDHYRRLARYLQHRLDRLAERIAKPELFEQLPASIAALVAQVLPPDNSTLAFGGYGGGLSTDLDAEVDRLYERLVSRYVDDGEAPSRSDSDVWQVFRRALQDRNVIESLRPLKVKTPLFTHTFDHAWKNERWHPIEPVSLDLVRAGSIVNKANQWVGRSLTLLGTGEIGSLTMMVGAPREPSLTATYQAAIDNLRAQVGPGLRVVEEAEAEAFSTKLAEEIAQHSQTESGSGTA